MDSGGSGQSVVPAGRQALTWKVGLRTLATVSQSVWWACVGHSGWHRAHSRPSVGLDPDREGVGAAGASH